MGHFFALLLLTFSLECLCNGRNIETFEHLKLPHPKFTHFTYPILQDKKEGLSILAKSTNLYHLTNTRKHQLIASYNKQFNTFSFGYDQFHFTSFRKNQWNVHYARIWSAQWSSAITFTSIEEKIPRVYLESEFKASLHLQYQPMKSMLINGKYDLNTQHGFINLWQLYIQYSINSMLISTFQTISQNLEFQSINTQLIQYLDSTYSLSIGLKTPQLQPSFGIYFHKSKIQFFIFSLYQMPLGFIHEAGVQYNWAK